MGAEYRQADQPWGNVKYGSTNPKWKNVKWTTMDGRSRLWANEPIRRDRLPREARSAEYTGLFCRRRPSPDHGLHLALRLWPCR